MTDSVSLYDDRFVWFFCLWLMLLVAGAVFNKVTALRVNTGKVFFALLLAAVLFDVSVLLDPARTPGGMRLEDLEWLLHHYHLYFVLAVIHGCWFALKHPRPTRRTAVVERFADPDPLTTWVRWSLYVQIPLAMAGGVCHALDYQLVANYQHWVYQSHAQAMLDEHASTLRMNLLHDGVAMIGLVSAFLMLKWMHRISFNAWQLHGGLLRYTPGAVICGLLIPPLVLWRPVFALRDIWAVSQAPRNPAAVRTGPLPWCWWLCWLAAVIFGTLYNLAFIGGELEQQNLHNGVGVLLYVAWSALAFTSLVVVRRIHDAQVAQAYQSPSWGVAEALRRA